MAEITLNLPDDLMEYLKERVRNEGSAPSPEGFLRLLIETERHREELVRAHAKLRELLQQGSEGPFEEWSPRVREEIWAEARRKVSTGTAPPP